ncbi:MAG TPA: hypothetical protein VGY48_02210 [Vicinamibacterales bacterium]|jgi:hypothetical protein|nr:hypothetical protein [Vicinamibacterales bacterium]
MTARPFALTTWLAAFASAAIAPTLVAQQPPHAPRAQSAAPQPGQPAAPAAPGAPAAPAAARREGQPVNVRIDVTIADQRGGGAPSLKKTVSVVAADTRGGMIRSTASYTGQMGDVPLNVDVEPTLLADGKIRATVSLQYDLPVSTSDQPGQGPQGISLRRTSIRENLTLVLENGKPLVAAQSADPVGDRQVTIEVKATVLK